MQVDFDDGHCPSWRNQLSGWRNVYLAVRNQLVGAPTLAEAPVLMLRPRAWNMKERNITVTHYLMPFSHAKAARRATQTFYYCLNI